MDLNLGIISEVEKKLKKKLLIDYMYANLKHHNFWAYRYFFCELLTLLNIGGEFCSQSCYVLCFPNKRGQRLRERSFNSSDL